MPVTTPLIIPDPTPKYFSVLELIEYLFFPRLNDAYNIKSSPNKPDEYLILITERIIAPGQAQSVDTKKKSQNLLIISNP